ncbi:MAG TPA: hypothetical protein VL523_00625 [Terriglobia bacterium]|nr:hypothetical protein [Terriglobia bacterium]
MTPELILANRANAMRSTGPRTEAGRQRSRMNALRSGSRCATYDRVQIALMECLPAEVRETAAAILTPEELDHPAYRQLIDYWCHVYEFAFSQTIAWRCLRRAFRKRRTKPERSLESRAIKKRTDQIIETNQVINKSL